MYTTSCTCTMYFMYMYMTSCTCTMYFMYMYNVLHFHVHEVQCTCTMYFMYMYTTTSCTCTMYFMYMYNILHVHAHDDITVHENYPCLCRWVEDYSKGNSHVQSLLIIQLSFLFFSYMYMYMYKSIFNPLIINSVKHLHVLNLFGEEYALHRIFDAFWNMDQIGSTTYRGSTSWAN